MALRSPTATHNYWGSSTFAALPTSANVQAGDTAYAYDTGFLYVCTNATGPVWTAIGTGTSGPPSGSAGGNLSGTYPNPTVAEVQGTPVSASAPASTNAMVFDGSQWAPAAIPAGGSSGQIQYNNAGVLAGAAKATIDNNDLVLIEDTAPATPAVGTVKLVAQPASGREMTSALTSSGGTYTLQPHMGRMKYGVWQSYGNSSTSPAGEGLPAPTVVGTATARTVATTNLVTSMRRLGINVGTAAASIGGWRHGALQFMRGSVAKQGGFHYITRLVIADQGALTTGVRTFVGLQDAIAPSTVTQPSALTNIIGLASDSADANFSIMHNDASGAATVVPLGASFPAYGQSTDAYEVSFYAPPNGSTVDYRVTNLVSGAVASGTLSTNLPAGTVLLTVNAWKINTLSPAPSAPGIDLVSMYIETEY